MEPKKISLITIIVLIAGFGIMIGFQAYTITQLSGQGEGVTLSTDLFTEETTLDISGSTTCYPTITTCADLYMSLYPSWDIRVGSGGSGQGAEDLANGVVDIAMMSRNPKPDEIIDFGGLENISWYDTKFALDGVSVIASKAGTAPNIEWMTLDELHMIYTGVYTNWNELSNCTTNLAPNPRIRESGSGTRGTFEELVIYNATGEELGDNSSYTTASWSQSDGNPAMAEDVGNNAGSIGYVGLAFVDDTKHILIKIKAWNETADDWGNPIEPTESSIRAGDYAISRFLHLITLGPVPTGVEKLFIDFVMSETGQDIVEATGYIKVAHY
jgi:phosphate transport system substrate-binding protein